MKEERKAGTGNIIIGVLLILFGLIFFLAQFLDVNLWDISWPFLIIVPGVVVYIGSLAVSEDQGKGFSALGSIVTMVGLVLLYQNTFDRFETWAYAWALVGPTAVGLGWIGYGLVRRNRQILDEGLELGGVGLAMFLVAAAFFELVIGIGGDRPEWAANLWPLLLILLGLFFLVRNLFGSRRG